MLTLKFTVIRFEGPNETIVVLVDEKDKPIMVGDDYHDAIKRKIEGFFDALNYIGIEHEITELTTFESYYESKYYERGDNI